MNEIYLSCGVNSSWANKNDLFKLDREMNFWKELETRGQVPPLRRGAAFVFDKRNGLVYTFGGFDAKIRFDLLHVLDLRSCFSYFIILRQIFLTSKETLVWKELPNKGNRVGGRSYSSLVLYGQKLIIFGGRLNESQLGKDMYCYDLEKLEWTMVDTSGEVPKERYAHSTSHPPNSRYFYIYGGLGSRREFGDVWRFDLEGFPFPVLFSFGHLTFFPAKKRKKMATHHRI